MWQDTETSVGDPNSKACVVLVQCQCQGSAIRCPHCLDRIEYQIYQHLIELDRVGGYRWQGARGYADNRHVLQSRLCLYQFNDPCHQCANISWDPLQRLRLGQSEKSMG